MSDGPPQLMTLGAVAQETKSEGEALRQQADSRQGAARGRDGQGNLFEKIALNQGHAAAGKHPGCGRA